MLRKSLVLLGFLSIGMFAFAACSDDSGGGAKEANCSDGVDNDGDNRIDCADPDCATSSACQGGSETNCSDGVDNDNDGMVDCADSDCANDAACQGGSETNCSDGIDNDNDGTTDCSDSDCANDAACQGGGETNCSDGVDNDNDGMIDCSDVDCANDAACQGGNGALSCMGINACMQCCAQNDQDCVTACMNAGSQGGQAALNGIVTCMRNSCNTECSGNDNEACNNCLDQHCQAELDACDWETTGTGGCQAFMSCSNNCPQMAGQGSGNAQTCPNDPGLTCIQDCMHQTSQAGFDAYIAIVDCAYAHCQSECIDNYDQNACNTCLGQNCQTEINNCQ